MTSRPTSWWDQVPLGWKIASPILFLLSLVGTSAFSTGLARGELAAQLTVLTNEVKELKERISQPQENHKVDDMLNDHTRRISSLEQRREDDRRDMFMIYSSIKADIGQLTGSVSAVLSLYGKTGDVEHEQQPEKRNDP